MKPNKVGNVLVSFADRGVALDLAEQLGGEYRGANANLGIKHWIEVPKLKADALEAWLRVHGRQEHVLLAQVRAQKWGTQPDAFYRDLLAVLKRSGSRELV